MNDIILFITAVNLVTIAFVDLHALIGKLIIEEKTLPSTLRIKLGPIRTSGQTL